MFDRDDLRVARDEEAEDFEAQESHSDVTYQLKSGEPVTGADPPLISAPYAVGITLLAS